MKALSISFITALRSSLSTMAVYKNNLQMKSVLQSLLYKQHQWSGLQELATRLRPTFSRKSYHILK